MLSTFELVALTSVTLTSKDEQVAHEELSKTTSRDFKVYALQPENITRGVISELLAQEESNKAKQSIQQEKVINNSLLTGLLTFFEIFSLEQQAKDEGYELIINIDDAVTVSRDGYYLSRITIPSQYVGQKVSELKLYSSIIGSATVAKASAGVESVVWTFLDAESFKITDTLKDSIILATLLPIEKSFWFSIGRLILAFLAAGCESDTWGSVTLFAVLAAAIFFVKRHKKYLPR